MVPDAVPPVRPGTQSVAPTDRVESIVIALALLAGLLMVPIGAAVGPLDCAGLWLLLWILVLAVRRRLDRRRLSYWEAERKRVAPRWTSES